MEKITIDDFKKIELRVGKILESVKVENKDKLLVFKVDVGEEEPREIISGIAEYFDPAELVGRKCVVVSNLEKKKLAGIESNGMIVGSDYGDNNFSLLEPDSNLPVGSLFS